jgi:uroporphyrinogen III methyltransferase/synthase
MAEGPLQGLGVAVTRGERGDGPLTSLLASRGAIVLDWGSITFSPPDDPSPLLSALERIREYDWICFSSPRAVEAVVSRVQIPPEGVRMAVVGPSTAASLREAGWWVDRIPEAGSGEELVEAFRAAGDAKDARVFFPASAVARDVIPQGLTKLGAVVDRTTAYQLVTLPVDGDACLAELDGGRVQVVTFASPSAMKALREEIGQDLFQRLARDTPAASMGPTTSAALSEAGWEAVAEAAEPTLEALVEAVTEAVTEAMGDVVRDEARMKG